VSVASETVWSLFRYQTSNEQNLAELLHGNVISWHFNAVRNVPDVPAAKRFQLPEKRLADGDNLRVGKNNMLNDFSHQSVRGKHIHV